MSNAASPAIDQFVKEVYAGLQAAKIEGVDPPLLRRKLRTVLRSCGYRAAKASVLRTLHDVFTGRGLYTEPALVDRGIRPGDWITFSTGPFPADAMFFKQERDLQRFIAQSVGQGPLRHLRRASAEYVLPSKRRIDVLCEEVLPGARTALVAMELKRDESARGAVEQLVAYMDELKRLNPGREVRGVIVSGREDRVGATLLRAFPEHQIEWFCYRVEIEPVKLEKA